ncbi:MAG: pyruvoyl-dependent arginine decarboxylase [bacterium]|nr:pyruvoyl-dependent arginine decarboxylase [bacterium]
MKIDIVSGIGTGPTALSAFDSALNHAGVANFNLVYLSSIIPPKSELVLRKTPLKNLSGEWGDRLFVVMANQRQVVPNKEAWAGIGWVQDPKTGKGLFVEHEGSSEKAVKGDIKDSLIGLMATRNVNWGPVNMEVVGRACDHEPVCALVMAVFESVGWNS